MPEEAREEKDTYELKRQRNLFAPFARHYERRLQTIPRAF